MKVLIFAFHDASYMSGVRVHVEQLKNQLKKHGIECELWFSHGSRNSSNRLITFNSSFMPLNYAIISRKFPSVVKKFNPDIIHMHGAIFVPIKRPIVITNHGLLTGEAILQRRAFYSILAYDRIVYRQASKIIAVSSKVKSELISYLKIPEGKIEIIPNGILINSESAPEKSNVPLRILFIKPILRKGIVSAFKAMKILHRKDVDFEFHIVGSYDPLLMDRLLCYAEANSFRDKIKLWGFVSHSILDKIFSSCSVFLIPSFYEAFPIAALEAMAHGLPIIAGNLPTEVVIENKTGFFINPRNPDDIAEKLAIFTDKKLFLDFSRATFEHVIKNFSWENVIKRIIKLYMAVLAGEA